MFQAETKDYPQSFVLLFLVLVLAVYEKNTNRQEIEQQIWTQDFSFLGIFNRESRFEKMSRLPFPAIHS